jgi:GR25 family glycosyltransferase involved in LPS biosynthesis
MNLDNSTSLLGSLRFRLRLGLERLLMPRPIFQAFGKASDDTARRIQKIYVINLDRQPRRWSRTLSELNYLLGNGGITLSELASRFSAIDGKASQASVPSEIEPIYLLSEQLFVAPEPLLGGSSPDEERYIKMSLSEVAVAHSHIEVWKLIAASDCEYTLVVEDDVYFNNYSRELIDKAWSDLHDNSYMIGHVDMLYLSYKEPYVKADRQRISEVLFRPLRGLWDLSGYVLSKNGAQKLLDLTPVKGPVDLWMNHQFKKIGVFAITHPVIQQRPDAGSDNVYSILEHLP